MRTYWETTVSKKYVVTGTQNQRELWRGHLGGGLVTFGCKGQSAQSEVTLQAGSQGNEPGCHSLPIHTCEDGGGEGGKSEGKNYLTFLSLIFLICERGNNNIYLSMTVSVRIK